MINESYYWKIELYKSYKTIAEFEYENSDHMGGIELEKALLMGAYIIRKLKESFKFPESMMQKEETLKYVRKLGTKCVDVINRNSIDENYDFKTVSNITKNWSFIINQIIHSYCIAYCFDDKGKIDSFLINSDRTKEKLFYLPVKLIYKIFLSVSEGDATKVELERKFSPKSAAGLEVINMTYSYPKNLKIDELVSRTLNDCIYDRKDEENDWSEFEYKGQL